MMKKAKNDLWLEKEKLLKEKRGNRTKSVETSAKNGSKKTTSSKNLISVINPNNNKGKSNNTLPFISLNNNYDFSTKTFQAGNDKIKIINIPQGKARNILHATSGPLNKNKSSIPSSTEPTNKTRNIIHATSGPLNRKTSQGNKEEIRTQKKEKNNHKIIYRS